MEYCTEHYLTQLRNGDWHFICGERRRCCNANSTNILLSGHQSEMKFMEHILAECWIFYIITVGCCSDRVISLIADRIGNVMWHYLDERSFFFTLKKKRRKAHRMSEIIIFHHAVLHPYSVVIEMNRNFKEIH